MRLTPLIKTVSVVALGIIANVAEAAPPKGSVPLAQAGVFTGSSNVTCGYVKGKALPGSVVGSFFLSYKQLGINATAAAQNKSGKRRTRLLKDAAQYNKL